MSHEKTLLNAIHSLTLVQRSVVFRPALGQTTDAIGTRIVFATNELIHAISSRWLHGMPIKLAVDGWSHEILNLALQMPRRSQANTGRAIRIAEICLMRLVEIQGGHERRESNNV